MNYSAQLERKENMKSLFVLACLISVCSITYSQQVRFTIYGHDPGVYTDTIDFGVDTRATFCEDTVLGERNNDGPPPFPFAFTWVNPRVGSLCDYNGCFDCGRRRYLGKRSLDLRPFTGTTQIDTFCIFIESYDAGYPFYLGWMGLTRQSCDSIKLIYTGSTVGTVVVNMFDTSRHVITDPSVMIVSLIMWGVKDPLGKPQLSLPANNSAGIPLTESFSWQPLLGANGYVYQVASDSLFTSPLHTDTVLSTNLTVGPLDYHTSYFWHVRGLNPTGPSDWSDTWTFTTLMQTFNYSVSSQWNIISLPLTVPDAHFATLFPAAISKALSYSSTVGYQENAILTKGVGYWARFRTTQAVHLQGIPITNDTIGLVPGWNLIGSNSDTVSVNGIESFPPDNLESFFYGYTNGISIVTTLLPLHGYWIKAVDSGEVILSASGGKAAEKVGTTLITNILAGCNTIEVTDAAGNSHSLYFSKRPDGLPGSFNFELPPAPASDIFDVRFGTGQSVEFSEIGKERDIPIIITSATYPVTFTWNIQSQSAGEFLKVGNRIRQLLPGGRIVIDKPETRILLQLPPGASGILPATYGISENYPNPFNPTTTIGYELPTASRVSLKIYNLLGQVVMTLADRIEEAGSRQVQWDASTFSSGVYFYRFDAVSVIDPNSSFSTVRKMVLMK